MSAEDAVFVTFEVKMTIEEYNRLKSDAAWESGHDVAKYLVDNALGRLRRGC